MSHQGYLSSVGSRPSQIPRPQHQTVHLADLERVRRPSMGCYKQGFPFRLPKILCSRLERLSRLLIVRIFPHDILYCCLKVLPGASALILVGRSPRISVQQDRECSLTSRLSKSILIRNPAHWPGYGAAIRAARMCLSLTRDTPVRDHA